MSDLEQEQLARLTSLSGSAPPFEPDHAPEAPGPLFQEWFEAAVAAGVAEPHAMTLSTVTGAGAPDARVLILKDFDPAGRWAFASSGSSAKGTQLAERPVAALTFYWAPMVRSVRIRGGVAADAPDASRADFRARSTGARAVAVSGRQSDPMPDPAGLDAEIALAHEALRRDPDSGADIWRKYWLTAETVEFWQGDRSRRHIRLQYRRQGHGWDRRRLRP